MRDACVGKGLVNSELCLHDGVIGRGEHGVYTVGNESLCGERDFFGGRSGTYESVLREAKDSAMREMAQRAESLGCNAIVGIDLDYETVGQGGSMLMVTCSGTAVII